MVRSVVEDGTGQSHMALILLGFRATTTAEMICPKY